MSRPIPIEIIPSHVHLSDEDHRTLFGANFAGTVEHALSQRGQFAYQETVEILGRLKRSLKLRILGPYRKQTQVELTPHEAALLGIAAIEARSGDLSKAANCTLRGPAGQISAKVAIVPKPHLHASESEAKNLSLVNGQEVTMEIVGETARTLPGVIVRVHPTYTLRLHVHPELAQREWYVGTLQARIRETHG